MNPVITWIIERLDCLPVLDGHTDVVIVAAWRCVIVAGAYIAAANGVQQINYAGGDDFTPFIDLTHDQVLAWVHDAMGPENVASLVSGLTEAIAKQVNPDVVTYLYPFLS